MQWKSKLGISVFLTVLALLFALSAFAQARPVKGSGSLPESGGENNQGAYVLREQDGYIAVYRDASGVQSVEKTDIDVDTLRRVDRDMLEQGIAAKTEDELLCLLEDFGS